MRRFLRSPAGGSPYFIASFLLAPVQARAFRLLSNLSSLPAFLSPVWSKAENSCRYFRPGRIQEAPGKRSALWSAAPGSFESGAAVERWIAPEESRG